MAQHTTITRLFDDYIKETNSNKELRLLIQSFNKTENERLLRRLISDELKSGFDTVETVPGRAASLTKSYRKIKGRIR